MTKTGPRVELPLSEAQRQYISLGAFIFLFPVLWIMYRHYKSLQRRYPSTSGAGGTAAPGTKIKTT